MKNLFANLFKVSKKNNMVKVEGVQSEKEYKDVGRVYDELHDRWLVTDEVYRLKKILNRTKKKRTKKKLQKRINGLLYNDVYIFGIDIAKQ